LWTDPVGESVLPERSFHRRCYSFNFVQCFRIRKRSSVTVATAANNHSESIAPVVSKAYLLMRATENFNFDIRKFDIGDFVDRCVDDKELGRYCPLVFGSSEKKYGYEEYEVLQRADCKTGWFPNW